MASGALMTSGKYKLLGTATGSQAITLPSDFEELYLLIYAASEARYAFLNIPRIALLNTSREFRVTTTNIQGTTISVIANLSQVQINKIYFYTNVDTRTDSFTNTSTLTVYYR